MYKIESLNLSGNERVDQGFVPETIEGVSWEIAEQRFSTATRLLTLDVSFTAKNFAQVRAFTYSVGQEIDKMGLAEMYALLLQEEELKDSTLV